VSDQRSKSKAKWWQPALLIVFSPFILLALILSLAFFLLSSLCLHVAIWAWWCTRGRNILFVYSDSPIWHDYMEQHVLPYLGKRAVVLNWSQRRGWRISLSRMAVHHFGGSREFNPLAVVFRPFRRTRTFRFFRPFRDYKHGNPETLHKMENDFFGLIGVQRHETQA
jgi:hypothetical protein